MRPRFGLSGVSFLVSAVILALEVAHIRLLSYATDPRLVYGAISIAFAGLGGGSIAVAIRPELARGAVRPRLVGLTTALAVAIVAHAVAFAQLSPRFSAKSWGAVLTGALPVLAVCALPYVLGGAILSIAIAAAKTRVHRVYGLGMAGSALGCFALFPFMRSVGLEPLLAILGALAAFTGVLLAAEGNLPRLVRRPAAIAALCLAAAPFAPTMMPFEPDPDDLLGMATSTYVRTHDDAPADFAPDRDFHGWDPVSRVEVFTFPGDFGTLNDTTPIKLVTQDGGAGTILIGFAGHEEARAAWTEHTVYATGYFLKPAPAKVLVVGLGGGVDVVTALQHGAGQVTGIELNQTILEVASEHFGAFQGGVLSRPEVTLVHADGRSYLEHAQSKGERFSLIQMSGADTYSAGSAGAFMFSESYLYTVEAFERYLRALEPGGVVSLIRFGPEQLRTVVTASVALRRLGISDPSRHFVLVHQGLSAGIAIGLEPFSDEAVARLVRGVAASSRVSLPMWEAMGFGLAEPIQIDYLAGRPLPGHGASTAYAAVLEAARDDASLNALLDSYAFDYSPATDDRPFFFQFLKPKDWLRLDELGDDNFFASGLLGHMRLVTGFMVLAALLTLAPLVAARRRRSDRRRPSALAFFACLGLGYMLVELVLIQRTVLLLGHPTHSVSVTLATLLVGSGMGSLLTGRTALRASPKRAVLVAVTAIAALVITYDLALGTLVGALLPLPWLARAAALVVLVLPLGLVMGIPFPLGLWRFEARDGPMLIAWGLGLNGFMGVLGSLLAVPLAMVFGFRVVLVGAVAIYVLAALAFSKAAPAEV